jgi:1,4-alpha-glucan branching enzyme
MAIQKSYLKTKPVCKVKFILPKAQLSSVKQVCVVGTFNNWDMQATELRKQKSGDYTVTLELPVGEEHQFRYLIDGTQWENDDSADNYVPANVGSEQNSVIVV